MQLTDNVFVNNIAYLGGGGIYFHNKLLKESPRANNKFINNTAYFANDFYTFPIRLHFQDSLYYKSMVNKSTYALNIIPGITNIKLLHFDLVDYYDQPIKSLNNRYFYMI